MQVLLGVGGGDHACRALTETVERARTAGDDLTVAVYAESDASLSERREAVLDRLHGLDFEAPIRTIEGDPGSGLVTLAEDESFDRIALSGGTRSPLGKIQLDPVSEFVLLNAPMTVTLVR
jgi:nucleotide-binding universal stress UspA family protein